VTDFVAKVGDERGKGRLGSKRGLGFQSLRWERRF
jgi:hypothetical protein